MMVIERTIKSIINDYFGIYENINPETRLRDIDMDSLDEIELVMALEDEYGIEISDDDFESWVTIGDVVAYLKKRVDEPCLEEQTGSLSEQAAQAEQFVVDNLKELCQEMVEWSETAILPYGVFRELCELCSYANNDRMNVASALVKYQALKYIANQ